MCLLRELLVNEWIENRSHFHGIPYSPNKTDNSRTDRGGAEGEHKPAVALSVIHSWFIDLVHPQSVNVRSSSASLHAASHYSDQRHTWCALGSAPSSEMDYYDLHSKRTCN